ncbi:MAG: lamin tail domain-containing protein [Bacteroidota bacterium]
MTATLFSCKTEDTDPAVTISTEDSVGNNRISENSGSTKITATLNSSCSKVVNIKLSFSGRATEGEDYSKSSDFISIPAGKISGYITITALQDNITEGDDSIAVRVTSATSAINLTTAVQYIVISDDDQDSDNDGISDAGDLCPQDSGTIANSGCPGTFGIIINEVLYDPSNAALEGDANGDGAYDQEDDAFIELINVSPQDKDISGFTVNNVNVVSGVSELQFTFPANTIAKSRKAIVVFGGGTPAGDFGKAQVFVAGGTNGLSLQNSGERIEIRDNTGVAVAIFDSDALADNPNESYTRNPDISGAFVQHHTIAGGRLFSPGTRVNGLDF